MGKKEVFISYHGGNVEGHKSSYYKAEELSDYLESKGIDCFLYKKTNDADFYDSINQGLLECKHFILVACDKDMLSEWVRDEVKQFDSLRKNGKKPGCVISAYIFGSITEEDLYNFNTLFSTKDIMRGDDGFEKLYKAISSKRNNKPEVDNTKLVAEEIKEKTFDDVSINFLSGELKDYTNFSEDEYLERCRLITKRLKCMSTVTISYNSENIVEDIFNRIRKSTSNNLYKISGPSGTQKSYVLQMLYVFLKRHDNLHNFEPVYLHCENIRDIIENGKISGDKYLESLFENVNVEKNRVPLFIIDGVLNVTANDYNLDYSLKTIVDNFNGARVIIGINQVFNDNPTRTNKSSLVRGFFDNNLNFTPISLYDKEKCIDYISTIDGLPIKDAESTYELLNKSGLLTIDEEIIRKFCSYYDVNNIPNIMDVFETEILEYMNVSPEKLKYGLERIFDFAYGVSEIDFSNKIVVKLFRLICKEATYLNCIIAMHYFNKLEEYEVTKDFSFFQMIFPKEITRFITVRINNVPKYEAILLELGKRYHEMSAMGQSEMSFFLGRIKNVNYRKEAIELLNRYYTETKQIITQKIIDDNYNGKPYLTDEYKQDLFLLRGLSVSLIYCGDKTVLNEYLRSLIDNDLSNSINRGFHLEYYGDKRYLPNQNMLDYEDNPRLGERTLRILCNSVDSQLITNRVHHALLLELFTIVSLLQVRIEIDKKEISFNIQPYILRCKKLIITCFERLTIEDNVIRAFFNMALEDFDKYIEKTEGYFSPQRSICNEYLAAQNVKRAGWVMQNIEDPESIVEHMYSCWFIGLVFLPNDDNTIKGYNKQRILNMLLIHDLAETRLSDIPKYEKVNYPDYGKKENDVMLGILLKGTYKSIGAMTPYVEAWDEWYEMKDENAKIAKDIDVIQAIYQFLIYDKKSPDKFSEERRINWLKEIYTVKTNIGKRIITQLICKNEEFKDILKPYSELFHPFSD